MDDKKISIIVTCYNYCTYIAGCLDSILSQSYQDYEVIIINDGSTDNTEKVVQPYLENPRIKYYKQSNKGQTISKNNGIKYSTGKFIAFLDADDIWEKDKLEKQIPLFLDKNIGVVYSQIKLIDRKGNESDYKIEDKYLLHKAGNVTKYLFFNNFIPFSSSVVRRDCFEKCGLFDESLKMGIDWDLWLRISVHYRFAYIAEPLLLYRMGHPGQMSRNLEVRQKCSDTIMKKFVEQNPNILSPAEIHKAWAYTYNNRGRYFLKSDPRRSLDFCLRSIKERPLQFTAYKTLINHSFIHHGKKHV